MWSLVSKHPKELTEDDLRRVLPLLAPNTSDAPNERASRALIAVLAPRIFMTYKWIFPVSKESKVNVLRRKGWH